MWWFCDRTGFPAVQLTGLNYAVHLLPVAKAQFECFLAEPTPLGDAWYDQVLTLCPRVSWRRCVAADREKLWMSGLLPLEVQMFAEWLGPGWHLPTVFQWRQVYRRLAQIPLTQEILDAIARSGLSENATGILCTLLRWLRPATLLELSMQTGGLIEWVLDTKGYGGLGQTRAEFARNLCHPLQGDPVRPIDLQQRLAFFGIRLCFAPDAKTDAMDVGANPFEPS